MGKDLSRPGSVQRAGWLSSTGRNRTDPYECPAGNGIYQVPEKQSWKLLFHYDGRVFPDNEFRGNAQYCMNGIFLKQGCIHAAIRSLILKRWV
jgi:hypothetical protein